jgi:hypothetical protein
MHSLVGLLILIGAGGFVVFAFRQGMGTKRSGRVDNHETVGIIRDGQSHQLGAGGFGQS